MLIVRRALGCRGVEGTASQRPQSLSCPHFRSGWYPRGWRGRARALGLGLDQHCPAGRATRLRGSARSFQQTADVARKLNAVYYKRGGLLEDSCCAAVLAEDRRERRHRKQRALEAHGQMPVIRQTRGLTRNEFRASVEHSSAVARPQCPAAAPGTSAGSLAGRSPALWLPAS